MFSPQAVLDFWFLPPDDPGFGQWREEWFKSSDAFDAQVRAVLGPASDAASQGQLDGWAAHTAPALALIILLDQVPRNLFRGTPQAFAQDAKALAIADMAVGTGFDRGLPAVQRLFLYLPFEHSEKLIDQDRSCALFETLTGEPNAERTIRSAHRHREIIRRFGRYPHRNIALGRESTAEEIAFLKEPNSSF